MKITVFWNVEPCSLVDIERRFRGAYAFITRAIFLKVLICFMAFHVIRERCIGYVKAAVAKVSALCEEHGKNYRARKRGKYWALKMRKKRKRVEFLT
jgi:hypothetical protein